MSYYDVAAKLRFLCSLRFDLANRPGPLDGEWCEGALMIFEEAARDIEGAYEHNNTILEATAEQVERAYLLAQHLRDDLTGRIMWQWFYGPEIRVGTRVRFRLPVERYPHCSVDIGEFGKVTYLGADQIEVALEKEHSGLDEWDNEVAWYHDMFVTEHDDEGAKIMRDDFFDSIETITELGEWTDENPKGGASDLA